jgi:hypothetical protein
MSDWFQEKNIVSKLLIIRKLRTLLKTSLRSEIAREYPIDNFLEGLEFYKQNMTKGKILIRPTLKEIKKHDKES